MVPKTFNLHANVAIQLHHDYREEILEELTLSLMDIVEKYDGFCGGGFSLKEAK